MTDYRKFVSKLAMKKTSLFLNVSVDLLSRHVAMQVSSAQQSLTSVFGMGTGGPSALKSLTFNELTFIENRTKDCE